MGEYTSITIDEFARHAAKSGELVYRHFISALEMLADGEWREKSREEWIRDALQSEQGQDGG